MASSQKIISFCLCLALASFCVLVDAGQGMMGGFSGLLGGGGKGHHGGYGGIETLLAAGLLAKLLRGSGGGGGGFAARSAYGVEAQALPQVYGYGY